MTITDPEVQPLAKLRTEHADMGRVLDHLDQHADALAEFYPPYIYGNPTGGLRAKILARTPEVTITVLR